MYFIKAIKKIIPLLKLNVLLNKGSRIQIHVKKFPWTSALSGGLFLDWWVRKAIFNVQELRGLSHGLEENMDPFGGN